MNPRVLLAGAVTLASLMLAACAPASYNIRAPQPSGLKYAVAAPPPQQNFTLVDERRSDGKVFSHGTLPAELKVDGKPIDPIPFLATQLQAELLSRGLPVSVGTAGSGKPVLRVKTYRIENTRTNAYTPFITLTFISADLETEEGTKRLGVFVTRGKTPVWSFEEIIDPTFNQPVALGVRELATKIARVAYGVRSDDDAVAALKATINGTRTPDSFIDVYALGFTNNPAAIDTLVKLTSDDQEYVRQAAISSLGNLGATGQFGLLKGIYQNAAVSWQDHCVALKAIADLGTAESRAFITEEAKKLGANSSKENVVLGQILALYL